MESETVDPMTSRYPPPYADQYPLSSTYCPGANAGCKSQDLQQGVRLEYPTFGMPGQRTAGAATQGRPHIISMYNNNDNYYC